MAKKTQLGYQEIEERLRYFHEHSVPADDVAYRLLYCFGKSEAEIRRWRDGKDTLKTFDGVLERYDCIPKCYSPATWQQT